MRVHQLQKEVGPLVKLEGPYEKLLRRKTTKNSKVLLSFNEITKQLLTSLIGKRNMLLRDQTQWGDKDVTRKLKNGGKIKSVRGILFE